MSVKTFFEKVDSELKKLFGSSSFEQKAQSVITYTAPIVESLLALVDPPALPIVTGIINVIKSDLATVSTVVKQGTAAPGSSAAATIGTALTSINSNLSSLLTVAEVKNSSKVAAITSAVNLINGETQILLTNLPTAVAAK